MDDKKELFTRQLAEYRLREAERLEAKNLATQAREPVKDWLEFDKDLREEHPYINEDLSVDLWLAKQAFTEDTDE